MDLTINREALLSEVDRCVLVAARKDTVPIMTCVRIEAMFGGEVSLRATDTEIGMAISTRAEVATEGAVAVSARRLADVLKESPVTDVRLSGDQKEFVVHAGKYRARLAVFDSEDFPKFADMEGTVTTLPPAILKQMVERVRFAVGDAVGVKGMLWRRTDAGVTMVGTDGHRMAVAEHAVVTTALSEVVDVVLPQRVLQAILALVDVPADDKIEVEASSTENHGFFRVGSRLLFSRLVAGRFPAYERVIPKGDMPMISVDRAALLSGIRRVALLGETGRESVIIDAADGVLKLSASGASIGDAEDELDCTLDAPVKTRLTAAYVQQFLETLDCGQVSMATKGENTQTLWSPIGENGYRYVVMPIRL